jgi:glycine hydroxymethyltransferase
MPGVRGLRVVEMPFDRGRMTVDVAGMREVVGRERPALVVAGASLMLAAHPVAEIADAAHAVGAKVLFDAAHVAGLVAGGCFQRPLAEGADVMTCSTYKSFGGPPGGLVVSDDEDVAEAVDRAAYPGLTANYDASRLAALCVAEAEVLAFWGAYARACMGNARALADALAGEGFDVVGNGRSFTDSHHVALATGALGGGAAVAGRLEAARILSSAIGLPDDAHGDRPTGVRLGTQAVSRWGLGPAEMTQIATRMADVVLRGVPPASVADAVRELREGFATVGYCFA